ncbi:unnamed protein product, partial [Symbiodinium sp. KB8]
DPRYRLFVSVTGTDEPSRSTIDVYKRQGAAQVDVEHVVCEAAARFSERIEFHGFTVPEAVEWARTESGHRATELKFEYARLCRDAAQSWWAKLRSRARAKAHLACGSEREEATGQDDAKIDLLALQEEPCWQHDVDTILDEKEMKKAQTFLKRKITSKRQEYLEQDRKSSGMKDDVIKQEPKANKEFCKIVQELAQKNSEMPPPSSAISELLERSALLELRLRSWGLWTAYQLNHLKKDENYVTEGHHDVEFIAAPLKKVDRIVEKLALLNPASSPANKCPLKDAARGAIACKSIGLMLVVLQVVQREVQQNILLLLQVKDRWSHGKSAYGWSDVVLILAFPDGLGANVPFELQITHSKLFNTLFSRGMIDFQGGTLGENVAQSALISAYLPQADSDNEDGVLTVSTQRVSPLKVMALVGVMAVVGIMAGVAGDKILRSKASFRDTQPSKIPPGYVRMTVTATQLSFQHIFLSPEEEAALERRTLFQAKKDHNEKALLEYGLSCGLSSGRLLILSVGSSSTQAYDASGLSFSVHAGTKVCSREALLELEQKLRAEGQDYECVLLINSIGFAVKPEITQLVDLKDLEESPELPGVPALRASLERALPKAEKKVLSRHKGIKGYQCAQLINDFSVALAEGALAEHAADVIVDWGGASFKVFLKGRRIGSERMDANELLCSSGELDKKRLQELIQQIETKVNKLLEQEPLPTDCKVLIAQTGRARELHYRNLQASESQGSNERSWLQLVAKEKAAKQLRASSHEVAKAHSNVTKASNATVAPASACRNAVAGEACYNAVLWHKWIGVVENPGGYPKGVWRGSNRATIQQWLHDTKQAECPKPCFDEAYPVPEKKAKGSPSIYCFSVARAGPEIDTMYMQRQSGTGIFACDGHAVYSNTNTTIDGIRTIPIGNTDSGLSVDHTAANSQVFMRTWMTLLNNNDWWHYDFVAKVDPDAVLFPERMRGHLSWHVGQPVFFLNCAKWHPMMYGALEVFSKQALGRYLAQHGKCESGLHENCHANDGSVFKLQASIQKNHWVHVLVMKAGVCRGPLRAFVQSSSQDGEQVVPNLTTEDRRRILHAADDLLADDVNPTPTAVGIRMGAPAVDPESLRAVLRWRQNFGKSTRLGFRAQEFRQSEDDFASYAPAWSDPLGKPLHWARWSLRVFTLVSVLTPFLVTPSEGTFTPT